MENPLTPQQRDTVKHVKGLITPNADAIGMLFYARLFELDPALRPLFKIALDEQAHTIVKMLELCIEGLDNPAELTYALCNLGLRHVEYGVKPQDYATVREALLWTMERALGEAWDAPTQSAMVAALDWFIALMQGK